MKISDINENDDVEDTQEQDDHFASSYKLKENIEYEVNGYHYETDSQGRIKHCEGLLYLEEGQRDTNQQRHAGNENRKETDDGGHIIATRFNGSKKQIISFLWIRI